MRGLWGLQNGGVIEKARVGILGYRWALIHCQV